MVVRKSFLMELLGEEFLAPAMLERPADESVSYHVTINGKVSEVLRIAFIRMLLSDVE